MQIKIRILHMAHNKAKFIVCNKIIIVLIRITKLKIHNKCIIKILGITQKDNLGDKNILFTIPMHKLQPTHNQLPNFSIMVDQVVDQIHTMVDQIHVIEGQMEIMKIKS